jgi:plastocyanin
VARRTTLAAALVLALAGVACSNGYSNGAAAGAGTSTSPSYATMSPSSGGGYGGHGSSGSGGYGSGGGGYGSGGGGGQGGGGAAAATVTQADYQFTPSKFTVASDDTVKVTNSTPSTQHTFTIDGQDVDVNVDPATSQNVTLDLQPGTYTFYCRYHRSLGMTGTLTVT